MQSVLKIENLNKRFGSVHAVNSLNLDVNRGDIYGLLGPNGSGKTTTLGMLTGVVNPDSGSFSWFCGGNGAANRKRIGSLLEQPIFYPYLSGIENLKIVADIKSAGYSSLNDVLEQVGLLDRARDKFKNYSLGMKQRLAIAAALIGNPDVLILDEPTNGLDPVGIVQIRELILQIAAHGVTIIIASHLLDEIQKVCSHVCVMRNGVKIYSGLVEDFGKSNFEVILSADDLSALQSQIQQHKDYVSTKEENGKLIVRFSEPQNRTHLNMWLYETGVTLSHLEEQHSSLEKQFIELLSEEKFVNNQ